jgi:hypothetical protein
MRPSLKTRSLVDWRFAAAPVKVGLVPGSKTAERNVTLVASGRATGGTDPSASVVYGGNLLTANEVCFHFGGMRPSRTLGYQAALDFEKWSACSRRSPS